MVSQKRGQITIFIILGILLLLTVSVVVYVRHTSTKTAIAKRPAVEEVPAELFPLKTYIEDCLSAISSEGLIILGQQSGYIYPENYGRFSFIEPTDSDGIQFSRESKIKIPYWHYNKNYNKDEKIRFASLRPPLHRKTKTDSSIESQLDRYVESKLSECFLGFESFKSQGYDIKEKGSLKVTTSVVPGTVSFYLDYPLSVKKGDVEYSMRTFISDIPVDLLSMYNIATNITQAEIEYAFLERNLLGLLDVFSGLKKENLPPMVDSQFEYGKMSIWMANDVKLKVQSILTSYIPLLRVLESRNFQRFEFPEEEYSDAMQKIYDNMIFELEQRIPYDISFDYLGFWPIYFDVNDRGGVIMPQAANIAFAGLRLGLQRYYTVYDISYPVMITIYDPDAMNKKGYAFSFALESNIRNNAPVEDNDTILSAAEMFEESLFNDLSQRNSGEITLSVRDGYTKKPLEGVQVSFTADDESVFLGETDANGMFVGKFPVAYGGMITLMKADYVTKSIPIDTEFEKSDKVEAEMFITKWINITIRKMQLSNIGKTSTFPFMINKTIFRISSLSYPLLATEEATINLRRITTANEEDVSSGGSVKGTSMIPLKLAPGTYEVMIQDILNEPVTIPESKVDDVKIPAVTFEQFPNGGVDWSNESTYWTLTPANLYESNSITFYFISPGIADLPEYARTHSDLELLAKTGEFSVQYRQELEPTYG